MIAKTLKSLIRCYFSLPIILLGFLTLPSFAYTIEVVPKTSQANKITVRVKVLDNQRIPVQGLNIENLSIQSLRIDQQISSKNLENLQIIKFLPPNQTEAYPADIIILLDMSGSMKHPVSPKQGEVKKLQGATDAIREFLTTVRKDRLPFNIAIIPFGYGCDYSYQVNSDILKQNLVPVNNTLLDDRINQFSQVPVCAATNLYEPLKETVQYLGNAERLAEIDKAESNIFIQWLSQSSEQSQKPPRRLAVILLSDGFHIYQRDREQEQFEELSQKLSSYIPVHTLGYGESLTTLRDRADCPYVISDKELQEEGSFFKISKCTLPETIDITEFIVDDKRLREIAELTGGIHLFPDNAQAVASSLKTFLTSLREYELTFVIPDADRGSTHEFTLTINDSKRGINAISDPTKVTMDNFVYKSLPPRKRLTILFVTIIFGMSGILGFQNWSKKLKKQAKTFLSDPN